MENVTDALKMAFAVFVFIIALTIVFFLTKEIKATSDSLLASLDRETYYEWQEENADLKGRIVGEDTIIASLYSNNNVYILEKDGTQIYPTDKYENVQQMISEELNKGESYVETFVEVTTGGKYIIGSDDTELTVDEESKQTIIYVYYTKTK